MNSIVNIMSLLRHSRISVVPTAETELAIATSRFVQTEASVAQSEARVLQQWNMVQAILAKPPHLRHNGEFEYAQAALQFAERANARAEAVYNSAELDKNEAAARVNAASASAASPNGSASSCSFPSLSSSFASSPSRAIVRQKVRSLIELTKAKKTFSHWFIRPRSLAFIFMYLYQSKTINSHTCITPNHVCTGCGRPSGSGCAFPEGMCDAA